MDHVHSLPLLKMSTDSLSPCLIVHVRRCYINKNRLEKFIAGRKSTYCAKIRLKLWMIAVFLAILYEGELISMSRKQDGGIKTWRHNSLLDRPVREKTRNKFGCKFFSDLSDRPNLHLPHVIIACKEIKREIIRKGNLSFNPLGFDFSNP